MPCTRPVTAAHGATAYVTLEPCSHHGRTPPCADALIAAGVARVVVAVQDPNPLVAGQGIAKLRAAGIEVECGLMEAAARELNVGFFSRMTRGTPWVRSKIAASLDGRTALANGISKWITGEAARRDVQHWRARSCAVLTGIGTVLADDPQLNVRDIATERQPLRVVLDSELAHLSQGQDIAKREDADLHRVHGCGKTPGIEGTWHRSGDAGGCGREGGSAGCAARSGKTRHQRGAGGSRAVH